MTTRNDIVKSIFLYKTFKVKDIVNETGYKKRTVQEHLKYLVDKNLIEFIGKDGRQFIFSLKRGM